VCETRLLEEGVESTIFKKLSGAGVKSTIFKKLPGVECFGSVFYIIHISIYFDAYIFKTSVQNVESTTENIKT
jgi:hypothetical protein